MPYTQARVSANRKVKPSRGSHIGHIQQKINAMSEQPNEAHQHLARDGFYYATYQEMRNANVKSNEKRLRELGLDKMKVGRKVRSPTTPMRKPPTSTMTTPPSFESPTRRSNRVRRVTPERPGLEEDPFCELTPPAKRAKTRRNSMASSVSARSLSKKDRKVLENLPDWLNSMEKYLCEEENLSHQNVTSVMRQVVKLSTGVGITYSRWDERIAFAKGSPVDMSADFDLLYVEAVNFEEEHGRDLGNGKSASSYCQHRF